MNENCRNIIERIIGSQAKATIVRLLRENPFIMDNVRGFAAWAVLPLEQVTPEVEELASTGVLKKYGSGVGAVYRLTKDEKVLDCIDAHMEEIKTTARKRRPGFE